LSCAVSSGKSVIHRHEFLPLQTGSIDEWLVASRSGGQFPKNAHLVSA
jgi:hypothetical protein